jgi:hypothetical protein
MILAIESLCALTPDSFYLRIEAIFTSLRPSRNLLTEIEEKLEIIPDLFALNCALASRNEELAIITVSNLIRPPNFGISSRFRTFTGSGIRTGTFGLLSHT